MAKWVLQPFGEEESGEIKSFGVMLCNLATMLICVSGGKLLAVLRYGYGPVVAVCHLLFAIIVFQGPADFFAATSVWRE